MTTTDRVVLAVVARPGEQAGHIAPVAGVSTSTVRKVITETSDLFAATAYKGCWALSARGYAHAEALAAPLRDLDPMPMARAAESLLAVAKHADELAHETCPACGGGARSTRWT